MWKSLSVRCTYGSYVQRTAYLVWSQYHFGGGIIIKERLTTTMDEGVKKRTEIILGKLNLGWNDMILSSAMELLKEHDPKAYLDLKYREEEKKLEIDRTSVRTREENLQKIQHDIVELGELPESDIDIIYTKKDTFADEKEEFYQKHKKDILKQFANGTEHTLNFKMMIIRCNFKSEKEAIQWTAKRIKQENG